MGRRWALKGVHGCYHFVSKLEELATFHPDHPGQDSDKFKPGPKIGENWHRT